MNKLSISLLISLVVVFALPSKASDEFTIYLVRHAEKESGHKNPALTQCGAERAQQLASILSKVKLKHVYSTNYLRTLSTATPSAQQHKLLVEKYSPKDLKAFAQKLLTQGETSLVVGHSNTTPELANLLSGKKTRKLTEKEYRGLYQVRVNGQLKALTLLTQPLLCH